MVSVVRSGIRKSQPVSMRLTKRELALILRAMHLAVGNKLDSGIGSFQPMSEEVERLIAAMELFFDREKDT
jgi:hypothetical protein